MKWDYEKTRIPKRPRIKFLGLWHVGDKDFIRIMWRAPQSLDGLDYLADGNGGADYYVTPPDAFCTIPKIKRPEDFIS
jgi:hypothetical protein